MVTGPVTTLPQAIEWLRAEAPRLSADEIERLAKTAIEYADQLPVVVDHFTALQEAGAAEFPFGFDTRAMIALLECLPGTLHELHDPTTEPEQ